MKTIYFRKGNTIRNFATREDEAFNSISRAKRRSRELQAGQMGQGVLRVVNRRPPFPKETK